MQPTSGQIDSGEETTPAPNANTGRSSRMRTIQPLNPDLTKPKDNFAAVLKRQSSGIPQPLTDHPAHTPMPAATGSPLHDTALPHPVAPRVESTAQTSTSESVETPTQKPSTSPVDINPRPAAVQPNLQARPPEVDPLHTSVSATPLPQLATAPKPTIQNQAPPLQQSTPTQIPPSSANAAHKQPTANPLPQPVAHAPQQVTAQAPPPVQHTNSASQAKTSAQPAAKPAQAPVLQIITRDKNEALMRSSNPLGATLSGIELLINRNGIASIGYVSIFLAITGTILASVYAIGRFAGVELLRNNFSFIAASMIGVLLIATYLCSFVVCVASEAGQNLTVRQIFYLTRQNLYKLFALQIITIVATFLGLLLGIVPGVIILGRWMMAPFMIFESDHPSIMTALKRSNKLTKGRTVEMTGLVFAQVLLLSAGLLGFAAMAAGPAARYQQLRMRMKDKTAVTKVHFLNYIMSILLGVALLAGITGGGYQIYRSNQTTCYSTIKFVSGRPSPVTVCVKRHVCERDIICRETLAPRN